MTKTTHFIAIVLLGVAFGLPACGGPFVPLNPTWKDDIRPLMVARCIRCHDGDPGHVDPASELTTPPSVAFSFNYPADLSPPLPGGLANFTGLMFLKAAGPNSVRGISLRMPPPPAEALEDWQIEMLDNWAFAPR